MLELDDSRWAELHHAYGSAADIPGLLRRLKSSSTSIGQNEPWFTLWSSLAHQGDVYPASFAAVPYVIRVFASDPATSDVSFLHFPAWIEICRKRNRIAVPDFLSADYFDSLKQLPSLIALAASREWDAAFLACAMAALAAAKGHAVIAEAALELNPDDAEKFLKWLRDQ